MAGPEIDNPVLVNTWRGNNLESRHRGAVAVVDVRGRTILQLGDIHRAEFPRSAIKFLQAIPLIESGAADHFSLDDRRIAFACASHNGEVVHTDLAKTWLADISCSVHDLECGAELPLDEQTRFELIGGGGVAARYHHNCSGKHLGLLSCCKYMNQSIKGYRLYDHPVQKAWHEVLESLTGLQSRGQPWGYDGCGIPTIAFPLQQMARAFAHFADPASLDSARADAVQRISDAVASHPYMVAGRNRLCTALMKLTGSNVLVKTGAEGFYTACAARQGYGIALKIDDGHSRASMVALGAVLEKLGLLEREQLAALQRYIRPEVKNSRGDTVGRIEPASSWVL